MNPELAKFLNDLTGATTQIMRLERENQELKEEKVRLADELEKLWEQL